ncbi:MAG TPA: proline dehydrogenase family protein, partial [Actinomycetota bacterium]|nr:proline dehydrogenase family protein [Actinomycetota bacterium]
MLKATLLKAAGSARLKRLVTGNPVARRVAGRFIAGDTLDDAERAIRVLNDRGVSVALDYLGENTESEAQARESTGAYLAALDRIQEGGLDANISVKLTAMGLDLRRELALEEATRVAARGKEVGAMVGVDMEANVYVDRTLDVVETLEGSYDNVGVCLQAYLYRTRDDLDRLNRAGVPVRLVKGAYQEPPEVAYPQKASVDGAFARLLDTLVQANPYPMVATHDPALVRLTKTLVAK